MLGGIDVLQSFQFGEVVASGLGLSRPEAFDLGFQDDGLFEIAHTCHLVEQLIELLGVFPVEFIERGRQLGSLDIEFELQCTRTLHGRFLAEDGDGQGDEAQQSKRSDHGDV